MSRPFWAAVLSLCALLAPAATAVAGDAKELVAKLPAQNPADGQALAAELVKLGAAGAKEVCAMLAEPAQGGDAKARFALHGMALHAARPDAEPERQMLEGALLEALGAAPGPEVKAFLLEQLKLVARDASVAPAAKLLGDERLCEPATQLLLAIRTPAAAAALAQALPDAKGRNLVTVVRALGVLREKSVCKTILPLAGSEDAILRQTASYALANCGEPAAVEPLTKAAEVKAPYERSLATRALLLLAARLGEAGDKATCAKICRALAASRTEARESNVVCEALAALAGALGAEALPDLLAALDHKDLKIREGALQLLQGLEGAEVAAQLAARMKGASPESRAAIIRVLGSQRNKAALPVLTAALQDEDQAVRVAALRALGGLGADALAPLVARLGAAQPEEVRAIKEALSSMQCQGFTAALGGALPQATPAAKVALLEILAARAATDQAGAVLAAAGDADPAVRLAAAKALGAVAGQPEARRIAELLLAATDAALRAELGKALANACRKGEPTAEPVLAALAKAQGEARAELLKDLAWIGGKDALQAVLADSKSDDAARREAALRALSEWRDATPAPTLLALVGEAKERTHQVLALRGFLRLVGLPGSRTPEQTVELLKQAFAAVKEPDDRKLVLGGLSGVRHADAAALAATCLSDDAIKDEAAAAVIRIVCPANPGEPGLRGPAVVEALEKTAKATVNAAFRKKAEDCLAGLTTSGAANLAQGKPVKTSVAHEGNNVPERAVDGNTDRDAAWFGQKWPCWLEVDLQKPEKIEAVQVFFYHDGARYYQYTLSVSTDGKEYKQVADAGKNTTPAAPEGVIHKFEPVEARYVRINILKHSANQAVHLAELKVFPPGGGPKAAAAESKPAGPEPYTAGPHNVPPEGFVALFSGKDLARWKGLVGDPRSRAKMTPEALAAAERKATEEAVKHWKVEDGAIVYDGKNNSLCTAKDYGDFEMLVDWKIHAGGDSGIYLRGSPQVQIWDPNQHREGSGGLYNNQKNPNKPLKCADHPIGQWNRFRIRMVGDRVTIWLNEQLVVDNVVMENYWDRAQPIYPVGQLELQHHGSTLWFRNIFVKELPGEKK